MSKTKHTNPVILTEIDIRFGLIPWFYRAMYTLLFHKKYKY